MQDYHMDTLGWLDLGYSFVVDPSSLTVYEARGAGVQGGHTSGHNTSGHGVCVMGNYETKEPTPELIHLLAELAEYGRREGWWSCTGYTGGHKDTKPTKCPGKHLYAAIRDINKRAAELAAGHRSGGGGDDRAQVSDLDIAFLKTLRRWVNDG